MYYSPAVTTIGERKKTYPTHTGLKVEDDREPATENPLRTFSSGLGGIPPTSPDPAEISAALPGTPGNKRARSVSDGFLTCKG
jgi:hypothetical protein